MVSHQVHRDTRRTARAAPGPLVALSPRVRGLAKLLVLIALLVAAALAVRASPARGWLTPRGIEQLLAALREPWWAPLAFVAAYTIAAALDFSGLVLTLVGGAVFGFWWGALLNLLGANLGASAAFWVARLLGREGLHALLGDRKSTRLNSSHLVISYAVFCLKKKNINKVRAGESFVRRLSDVLTTAPSHAVC